MPTLPCRSRSTLCRDMTASATTVLPRLLREADLPGAVSIRRLSGRGFDNVIHVALLADGRQVVLRQWREPRPPEQGRALFLAAHGVPAPRLLAGTSDAALYEFVPGALLGDLIEAGRDSVATWRAVGLAFRQVHAVRFPPGLAGDVLPDRLVLFPIDPAAQMHGWLEGCVPGLRRLLPEALPWLTALHAIVDRATPALRHAATSLGHGDINMWNIIVADDRAWLIDWDEPRICDPAMEVALLDKHAALF